MTAETTVLALPGVVETSQGPVTPVQIELLEKMVDQNTRTAQELDTQISHLRAEVGTRQARVGSILAHDESQRVSGKGSAPIEVARGMEQVVTDLEQSISRLEGQPHHGLGGLVRGFKDRYEIDSLNNKLKSAKAELESRYRSVADQFAGPTGNSDADGLVDQIKGMVADAERLSQQKQAIEDEVDRLTKEIALRREAVANLGFDAPAIEADLMTNGLRAVTTNLVLKRGEIAVVSVAASLCRYRTHTAYVGGSQGVTIPLGHGLRYRVSSFRGHPLQTEALTTIDEGNLVVTNQRLVFLGAKRDVSTPIAKLLQIEGFSNGVGIGREGRETRDIYLLTLPAYVVFFVQWILMHQS